MSSRTRASHAGGYSLYVIGQRPRANRRCTAWDNRIPAKTAGIDAKTQLQSSQVSRHDGFAEDGCRVGIFKGNESRNQYTDPVGAARRSQGWRQIVVTRPA